MKVFGVSLFFVGLMVATVTQAIGIPECHPKNDAGACIANSLTYLILRGNENHDANIPCINPYEQPNPAPIQALNADLPINFILNYKKTHIHGMQNIKVKQVKGFELSPNMRCFEVTCAIPEANTTAMVDGTVKLFSNDWTVSGLIKTGMKNLEIVYNFDCNLAERDGKQFVDITNIRNSYTFEDVFMKLESDSTSPILMKTVNHVVSANRKSIVAENEPSIKAKFDGIARALFTPILTKFAIQDFFQKNCE